MIVFITGATAGFGAAIARRFVQHGDKVIATGRRRERLDALREELGESVLPLALDVRDRKAVADAFAGLPSGFSEVDVLVNNAGLALGLEPAQESDLDDWDTMVDTNVKGLLYCTRAALAGMVARNRGHIVNLGSVAADFPYAGGHVYGATKAFVHQFTQNLNADLIGTGVRASCIEPGLVGGTEFSNVRFAGDDTRAAAVYAGTEALNAEDIADTVHWLASRPARMTVNAITLMPNCQSFAGFTIKRG
jgi:3-hydroxy acid dehydrogenase / malonic semialdehyde reductase